MKKLLLTIALVPLLALGCREFGGRPKAKVTIRVVDDQGKPVSGATVVVLGSYGSLRAPLREGTSDQHGLFTATLPSDSTLSFQARAPGHHPVSRRYFAFQGRQAWETGRWEPWNPTISVQLRKRTRQVPMFVEWFDRLEVPILNEKVGFDLLKGDWVAPYGNGEHRDFVFEAVRDETKGSEDRQKLKLTFSNPGDGLILVRQHYGDNYGLWLPGIAPENGYHPKWEWRLRAEVDYESDDWRICQNGDQDNNYYIRVRTVLDEEGKVVSAMYGKIYWGVGFGNRTNPEKFPVRFLYYLNPDGTRNTEFDVTQNLNPDPGIFSPRP